MGLRYGLPVGHLHRCTLAGGEFIVRQCFFRLLPRIFGVENGSAFSFRNEGTDVSNHITQIVTIASINPIMHHKIIAMYMITPFIKFITKSVVIISVASGVGSMFRLGVGSCRRRWR